MFLRILIVSVLAPVAACVVASLILYGTVDRFSFLPFIFAFMGSCLLLAPAYGLLSERGVPLAGRYVLLVIEGAIAGAIMLGLVSGAVVMGAFYGLTTAMCWVALHFMTKRVTPKVV